MKSTLSRSEILAAEYATPTSQTSTSQKNLETTSTSRTSKRNEADLRHKALVIAGDLAKTDPDDDLTDWYIKAYKLLGEGKFQAVANMARSGRKPKNLFGWLLKREMAGLER